MYLEWQKYLFLLLLVIFTYYGVYNSPDIEYSDRDEAVVMLGEGLLRGELIKETHLNNPISTGINVFFCLPFIMLFGNFQHLTFAFWLFIICVFYNHKYFFLFAFYYLCTGLIFRTFYYRLDEFYFSLVYLYLSRFSLLWLLLLLFSRNPNIVLNDLGKEFDIRSILDYINFPALIVLYFINDIVLYFKKRLKKLKIVI